MKSYIYLDNYRGFSDTLIPIRKVNFLVGENSTGKSSVLHIANLLSSEQFWTKQEFDFGNTELNFFNDLISSDSENSKTFTIGMAKCETELREFSTEYKFVLISFKNDEGHPTACKYTFLSSDKIAFSFIYGKKAKYKILDIKKFICDESDEVNLIDVFRNLINVHNNDVTGYKYAVNKSFPKQANLVILPFIVLSDYGEYQITDLLQQPVLFPNLANFDPIRSRPKRTYDGNKEHFNSTGDHTPFLIRKIQSKRKSQTFTSKLNKYGMESALFDSIEPRNFDKSSHSPFELNVVMKDQKHRVNTVGYGISQILPIVTEIIARKKNGTFIIQQPEVHLHPKAQAAFGDFIYREANDEKKQFLVETHSDFLIDRYRLACSGGKCIHDAQVLYFERSNSGNTINVIEIENDGKYCTNQPASFKEFFLQEELSLLSI